jgi:putative hydrolases of HD superfamily
MNDERSIIEFLKFTRKMHHLKRFTPQPGGGLEDDAQHSWSVAFTCMILTPLLEKEFNIKLDQEKMLKMALIHDIAELETEDTKPWEPNKRINKEDKERVAMHNITKTLPEDISKQILNLWEECEKRETLEAKIVKSIDRLDPVLHRTAFKIGWQGNVEEEYATIEALDKRQIPRHSFSKTIIKIYEMIKEEALSSGMFKIVNKNDSL